MAETPKKSVGRPFKKPSCSDFCRVCGCNFNTYYGDFKQRVSTENLFEIPKRAGVEKSRLADLLCKLGITCEQSSSLPSRVCAKCGTKIRNAIGLFRSLRGSLLFQPPKSVVEVEHSPIAIERFKRMAWSPVSEGLASSNDGVRTGKACRSIVYGPSEDETSLVLEKTDQLKVVIPTKDDTISLQSAPDALAEKIVKNIFNRNWKPVANAMFAHTELRNELMSALSKNLSREMSDYCHSESMLKYSTPSELSAFSNRTFVHEVKVFCPLWYSCIIGAANVGDDIEESINPMALATASIARHRNSRMSAFAKRISTVLVHTGAKADDFTRLNRLGICSSHKQVIRDQVEMGSQHDVKVLLWKRAIEEKEGTLLLIEEIQSQAASMDAPVDVSQTTLEGKYFYSELLFNKMSFLLHRKDGENCLASAEELASAKQELMKEEQVSYRYTF